MQLKAYLVDVRIHHRFWVAQKHLLQALSKLMEKLINLYFIDTTLQKSLYNVSHINHIDERICRELQNQLKAYLVDVRIHHRIWVAQKHLLQALSKLMEKFINRSFIDMTLQKSLYNVSHINHIDERICRDLQKQLKAYS